MNQTNMVVIVNFMHYSVSRPSILFMGLVLLAPLLASSHLVPNGCSYLVACLGQMSGCVGMVQSTGSSMSTSAALQFIILGFLSSDVLFVDGVFVSLDL